MANSEDTYEMAFHQVLHCLRRQNRTLAKQFFFGGEGVRKYNLYPSTDTMDHPDLNVTSFMENSIGLQLIKTYLLNICLLFTI